MMTDVSRETSAKANGMQGILQKKEGIKELTYKEIAANEEINAYLRKGDENLECLVLPIIPRHIVQRSLIRQERSWNGLDIPNMK